MEIENILSNEILKKCLIDYCVFLAENYNKTLSGIYRIKYNDLYPLLFHSPSLDKKKELFYSFTHSNEINPIFKIEREKIYFKNIDL